MALQAITDGVLIDEAPVGTAITTQGSALGSPTRVPVDRYISAEFAALENERLWSRVWQIACSVDHVAEPGDFFEYSVGSYSVLIVRADDGELRAFQNVCRHRGNAICQGAGSGLRELRCGYHRWTWDLQGRLREVPSRRGFGVLRNEDFPLLAASVGMWGPLVFVNLDPHAAPLDGFLEGVPDDIAWIGLEDFRCRAIVVVPVDANWKTIADGFSETYHVQGLHRQMLASMDDINSSQRLWRLHGKSSQPYGVPSPRFRRPVPDQEVWDSFVETQGGRMGVTEQGPVPPVPDGATVADVIAERIRKHHAADGVDLSSFDTAHMLCLNQYNLFPNSTVLVAPDLLQVLCGRPGPTPDSGQLVGIAFQRVPSPETPRSRPMDVTVPPDAADFGNVLNQDIAILPRVQRGLHQPGLTHLALSSEECRLINTHRNLETYLGIDPTELSGGPVLSGEPGPDGLSAGSHEEAACPTP
jgi:phenylpropionate dioxygenase-like ring-hydroxylating dioxygenase large terminal subunit